MGPPIIHPTAFISEGAELEEGVRVGPYCIVGPKVKIARGCELHSHIVIQGRTTVGKSCEFFPFCSIGLAPQDLNYKGEESEVQIGESNIFREYVSIHRGTVKENCLTKVGSHSLFMAHVHIGHDAQVGDHCVLANSVNLAGHVKLADRVVIGGNSALAPFVRVGRNCYLEGLTGVSRDIPPFCWIYGQRAKMKGINLVSLKRQGLSRREIGKLVDFFNAMVGARVSPRAFFETEGFTSKFSDSSLVEEMRTFIQNSKLGIPSFN